MGQTDLKHSIPPLPEGWAGAPDELLQWWTDNLISYTDGDTPSGQVGGAQPVEDVGLFYGEDSIEKFLNGKYRPITDVPIGALIPWASLSATPPKNYLLADGRSLLRADYPDLFAVIGVTWGKESDTTFNLPDLRGRSPVGSGIGDYKPQGIIGRMKEVTAGSYFGFEWTQRETFPTGAPTKSMKSTTAEVAAVKQYNSDRSPSIGMPWLIRYR